MSNDIDWTPDVQLLRNLEKKHKCPIWITRKHEYVPICKMNDYHLLNAYKMLVRDVHSTDTAYDTIDSPTWGPDPDSMAYLLASQERDGYERDVRPIYIYWITKLKEEIIKRGLEVPINT